MIPQTELRIGNWILLANAAKGIGYTRKVIALEETTARIHNYPDLGIDQVVDSDIEYEDLEGIPLHENMLEAFGFIHLANDDEAGWKIYAIGDFRIHVGILGFQYQVQKLILVLNYVHDLQNLYQSLTRRELKIEL